MRIDDWSAMHSVGIAQALDFIVGTLLLLYSKYIANILNNWSSL